MALRFSKDSDLSFTRNLVKRHKLVPHLDRWLENEPEHLAFQYEVKEKDNAWHPSGHCTPPVTDLYYYAVEGYKEERKLSSTQIKTFTVGHFWHQLLQLGCQELGFAGPEHIERKGKKQWGMDNRWSPLPFHWTTGAGDVAPCTLPNGEQFIVDFKTMGAHDFRKPWSPDMWFAAKYECQINIYMDYFVLERGIIIPVQKDSPHELKEIEFERNQPLIDAIYDKWEFVSLCLDEGIVPTVEDNKQFDLSHLLQGPVEQ
jgi:hypothetical protein